MYESLSAQWYESTCTLCFQSSEFDKRYEATGRTWQICIFEVGEICQMWFYIWPLFYDEMQNANLSWLYTNMILFHLSLPAESCGGVVQGLNGSIESPGFPHGYPNYANCTWLVITGERNRIQLTFVTLALEEDFDIVAVYDGQPSPGNLKMRSDIILSFPVRWSFLLVCCSDLCLLSLSLFKPLHLSHFSTAPLSSCL